MEASALIADYLMEQRAAKRKSPLSTNRQLAVKKNKSSNSRSSSGILQPSALAASISSYGSDGCDESVVLVSHWHMMHDVNNN